MRIVAAVLILCLTGCATGVADPNYLIQMEAYRFTISSQREVDLAKAKAEEARYVAMATIAERSDAQTKSMAIFALALSGRGATIDAQNTAVQLPRIPETDSDRALRWASIIVPSVANIALAGFSYSLGRVQSNNQRETTVASYNAFTAFKPVQQPFVPTTSTVNNITTTSNTDLWNRDGFVNVGGAGQQAPTTATQDNSPVVVVPPVFNVPVIVPGP